MGARSHTKKTRREMERQRNRLISRRGIQVGEDIGKGHVSVAFRKTIAERAESNLPFASRKRKKRGS